MLICFKFGLLKRQNKNRITHPRRLITAKALALKTTAIMQRNKRSAAEGQDPRQIIQGDEKYSAIMKAS